MPLDAALDALAGRRVFITGATGFIGQRLAELTAAVPGVELAVLVRNPRRASALERLGARIVPGDLSADLTEALASQDVLFNLAYDFRDAAGPNLARFRNLAQAAARAGVGRLVQASSIAVYDGWPGPDLTEEAPSSGPGGDYKTAKAAMEAEVLDLHRAGALAGAIVQPTIVYGPRSFLWTDLPVERMLAGGVVLPDDEAGVCNAVFVDDVVQGLILAATAPAAVGERFILSGPEPARWRDLFGGYAELLGRPEALILKPAESLVRSDAPPRGGLLNLPPVRAARGALRALAGEAGLARLRALARRGRPQITYPGHGELALYLAQGVCRIDKARAQLGYAPAFDLARGLEATAAHVKARA